MSNITAAKTALLAELQHAKKGMQFYAERIETFERMLAQLDGVDVRGAAAPKMTKSVKVGGKRKYTRKNAAVAVVDADDGSTGGREKSGASLPATRGDFWKNLVSEVPMSNKDILKAATTTLKIRPNPDALKKLKQRMANALTVMTKEGEIKSEGTGRARRFSRAA